MRRLLFTLILAVPIFVGCEADEIYDLNEKHEALVEEVADTNRRLTETAQAIYDLIDERVGELSEKIDAVQSDLQDAIADEAATRAKAIKALETKDEKLAQELLIEITNRKNAIAELRLEMYNNQNELVLALNEALKQLENAIVTGDEALAAMIQNQVASINDNIDSLQSGIAENAANIETNADNIETNAEDILANTEAIESLQGEVEELENELDHLSNTTEANVESILTKITDINTQISDLSIDIQEALTDAIVFNGYVTTVSSTIELSKIAEQGDNVRIYVNGVNHIEYLNISSNDVDKSGTRDGMLIEASVAAHAADVRVYAKTVVTEDHDGGTMHIFVEGKAIEELQEQVADIEEDVVAIQEAALAALSRSVSITIAKWGDNNDTTIKVYNKTVSGEKEYVSFDIPFDHYFYWHKSAAQLSSVASITAGSPFYLGSAVVRLKFKIGKVTDQNNDGFVNDTDAVDIDWTFNQKVFLDRQDVVMNVNPLGGTKDQGWWTYEAHPDKKTGLLYTGTFAYDAEQVLVSFDFDRDGTVDKSMKVRGENGDGTDHDKTWEKNKDIGKWIKRKIKQKYELTDAETNYYGSYFADTYTDSPNHRNRYIEFNRANTTLHGLTIAEQDATKSVTTKKIRLFTNPYDSSEYIDYEPNGGDWQTWTRPYNDKQEVVIAKLPLGSQNVVLRDFHLDTDETFGSIHENADGSAEGDTTFAIRVSGTAGNDYVTIMLHNLGNNSTFDVKGSRIEANAWASDLEQVIIDKCDADPNLNFSVSRDPSNWQVLKTKNWANRRFVFLHYITELEDIMVDENALDYTLTKAEILDENNNVVHTVTDAQMDDGRIIVAVYGLDLKGHSAYNTANGIATIKNTFENTVSQNRENYVFIGQKQGYNQIATDVHNYNKRKLRVTVTNSDCSNSWTKTRTLRTAAASGQGSSTGKKKVIIN